MSASPDLKSSARAASVGEALFPGTRRKVLELLFGQPQRAYSISELIERAGAGYGAVQREVERLAGSGLLSVQIEHRRRLYQANPDSPIYAELCSLVGKILGPADRLRRAIEAAGKDIELALLYGSVAAGTDRADSDIDVLIVSDALTLEAVFRLLAPVEAELGRKVSPTVYTSNEFHRRMQDGKAFLQRVLTGKYVVLKGEVDGSISTG